MNIVAGIDLTSVGGESGFRWTWNGKYFDAAGQAAAGIEGSTELAAGADARAAIAAAVQVFVAGRLDEPGSAVAPNRVAVTIF